MMGRVARSQKMLKLHGNIDDILSDAIDCASNAIYCDQFGRFFGVEFIIYCEFDRLIYGNNA